MNHARTLIIASCFMLVGCADVDTPGPETGAIVSPPDDTGDTDTDTGINWEEDSDGDGLTDEEEAELGTNPYNPDSDGDGYMDGEEVGAYTDPWDADDHPYEGGWPIDSCRDNYVGEGWSVDMVIEDVTWEDQFDDSVKLHDFCDHAIILVPYNQYAGSNASTAAYAYEDWEAFKNDGLILVWAVYQSDDDFVQRLSDAYDHEFPIVHMGNEQIDALSQHAAWLIRPGSRVYEVVDEYETQVSMDDIYNILP